MDKLQEIKKKIARLTQELHQEFHTEYAEFYPKYPWVLVYILPREQRIGSIWVPDDAKKQNKVTLEGVVVRLWQPYWSEENQAIASELLIGDHVLFSHSAGQPFNDKSKDEFRLVKEGVVYNQFGIDDNIYCKLNYKQKEVTKEVEKLMQRHKKKSTKEIVEYLQRNFLVYPKASKTLSGT